MSDPLDVDQETAGRELGIGPMQHCPEAVGGMCSLEEPGGDAEP